MIRRILTLMLMVALTAVSARGAGPPRNIARGKTCKLIPRPGYEHCTDSGDRVQLTDGVYSKGRFWTQKSTVGWVNAQMAVITVDLRKVEPISGVSLNTAAGTAGVAWPTAILVFVGDNDKTFNLVGNLVELSAAEGRSVPDAGYAVHRFGTSALATRGRFVRFVVIPSGPFIFADEVEVHRGLASYLKRPAAGRKLADVTGYCRSMRVTWGVRRRLLADINTTGEQLTASTMSDKARKPLAAELADLARRAATLKVEKIEGFRTVLPLNDLHRRVFSIQAEIWRAKRPPSVVVWKKNRWDMLSHTEAPSARKASLDVAMMRNEHRSDAVNISNISAKPQRVTLRIEGMNARGAGDWISVREVPFTDTHSGAVVAAALPDARRIKGGYVIDIPSGMTRQIWLTFASKGVAAGEYAGSLLVDPPAARVAMRARVYPIEFPKRPSLHLCGWDYTDIDAYDVTPENRSALISMLREYHVDTPWAQQATMPTGSYDKAGNMTKEPSDARFRVWLSRWPEARNYFVFVSFGKKFAGLLAGSRAHRRAVAGWAAWWSRRARKLGLGRRQLGLLLVDEPHSASQDRMIVLYARIIRATTKNIIIWNDPTWRKPWEARADLFTVSDVLCPNLPMLISQSKRFADFYVAQRQSGRELWFYSCSGPGRQLDPYAYHRMQAWFCWKYGASGEGFWAFGDSSKASSWNEYLSTRGAYTPLFIDKTTVTRGKHLEAIRAGVQDYEYMRMLRDRIAKLTARNKADPRLPAAGKLLDSAADRVTACMTGVVAINWSSDKDRGLADKVRIEILEMLTRLDSKLPPKTVRPARKQR
jgi:hypothetical protein